MGNELLTFAAGVSVPVAGEGAMYCSLDNRTGATGVRVPVVSVTREKAAVVSKSEKNRGIEFVESVASLLLGIWSSAAANVSAKPMVGELSITIPSSLLKKCRKSVSWSASLCT